MQRSLAADLKLAARRKLQHPVIKSGKSTIKKSRAEELVAIHDTSKVSNDEDAANRALDELRRSLQTPQTSATAECQTDRAEQLPVTHDTVK